jgi:hypothetical protein
MVSAHVSHPAAGLHEICQGLEINISDFFDSPLFDETNLEP